MNFDFSDDQKQLRDQARRFLGERCTPKDVRKVLEGEAAFDGELWKGLAELGLLGITIPEEFGGSGAGYLELAVLAEELGRSVAPVPVSSSIYLAAEAIMLAGSEKQKKKYLPSLASGKTIGTLALFEGKGNPSAKSVKASVVNGLLNGKKVPVADGAIADIAVVVARAGSEIPESDVSLYVVNLNGKGVKRKTLQSVDPTRNQAEVWFDSAPAELLGRSEDGWNNLKQLLDRAAVLIAFEQVGGSDRALEMGRDYALDRMAFGRQIGSFQAVKHILADMYVAATLARSNAYFAAWALSTNSSELAEAAAAARISATQAFLQCAKQNIQVHGGMGFTWEFDCHLYYRRANALAVGLGGLPYWEDRLIHEMRSRNAVAA